MDFGKKKTSWNWFIWFHEFFLPGLFFNFLAYCTDPDQNILLNQIDQALVTFTNEFKPPDVPLAIPKFDLGLDLAFESDHEKSRLKRSCPSSVGNMGFNSFNFLTFMVMVFNAVANANNNINNNVST